MIFCRSFSYFLKAVNAYKKKYKQIKKINEPKVIMFNAPYHGNLGDHAIVFAEQKFFADNFPKLRYTEMTGLEVCGSNFGLRKLVGENDVIAITGGGYLGSLWIFEEERVRHIVSTFRDKPVYIFPQTVFYSDDDYGKKQLRKTEKIFSRCKNLTIIAREKHSERLLKKFFPKNKVILAPDMVLYLDRHESNEPREGALLCLRNDKEKTRGSDDYIEKCAVDVAGKFSYTDTKLTYSVNFEMRKSELNKKFSEFSKARLVITDRLHGMIFAALTQTPCVVILSKSHKVTGVYEWIKYLNYIKLAENENDLNDSAEYVLSAQNPRFENEILSEHFRGIAYEIRKEY